VTFPNAAARNTGQRTSDNNTHPINLPAGVQPDELLLVVISIDGNPTVNYTGDDWDFITVAQSTNVTGAVFFKRATGDDALTVTTSTNEQSSHISYRLPGGSMPWVTSATGSSTNSDPPASGTLPFGAEDVLWIAARCGDAQVAASAAPTSFSNLLSVTGTTSNGATVSVAERALNAASLDPATFTSATEQWVTFTIGILPPHLAQTLTDNFNDNSISAAKWPLTGGTVAEAGAVASLSAVATALSYFETYAAFTLDESYFMAKVTPPSAGTATYAYAALTVYDVQTGYSTWIQFYVDVLGNRLGWRGAIDGAYQFNWVTGGDYDPVAHAWLRIRETGGQLFFETSPDSITWALVATETTPAPIAASDQLSLNLEAYRDAGATGTAATFDNVNLPVSQTVSPTTIAAPAAPGSPLVASIVYPTAIAAPAAPGSPTVVPGPVYIEPTTIPAPAAPGLPRIDLRVVVNTPIPAPAPPGEPTIQQYPRPPMAVDFWAVADDGSLLCPLPKPVSWQLSLIPSEAGAVQIEYPVDGLNFDALDERINDERDLYIRIRTDGTHRNSLGAILQSRDGDEVKESGTVRFIGSFHTIELDEADTLFNASDPKGETKFAAATAGAIMAWFLTSVQAAGYLKAGTKGRNVDLWWQFTATHDSAGTPWPVSGKVSPTWPAGKSLLAVAQQLRDWGCCEFEVTTDHEVRLYIPETMGTDHTLNDPPLVIRRGRDLTEAPRKTDVRSAITDLTVVGKDGVHVTLSNPTALARRGRKVAGFVSEGNLADTGSATAYGTVYLEKNSHGLDSLTHNLTFDQRRATPLREILPSDWVYSDTGAGLLRKRINQLTVAQRAGASTYTGGLVLGDLITQRDVSLQRQIDKLKQGATIPGTSEPVVSDGVAPAAPTGITVDSLAYKDGLDTYATLIVDWLPVTLNVDGTAATDVAGYRVRWILANDTSGGWVLAADTPATEANFGLVASGVEVFVQVAAYDRDGNQSPWSASYAILTETDLTPPPVPSTPTVTNQMILLLATWDGLASDGEPMPIDFRFCEVHVSITSEFTPDATTLYDRLHGAGTMPITKPDDVAEADWYGVERFVRLVALDWTSPVANLSAPSAQGSAIPGKVLSDDIFEGAVGSLQLADLAVTTAKINLLAVNDAQFGSASVAKLTAGIFSAALTLSGIFRTGTTGARGEWDATSFRQYNSSGVQTLGLVPGGISFITGEFRTALTNQRIVANPGGNVPDEIRVFPSGSGDYARIMSRTAPLDGSAAILIDGGAASGVGRGRLGAYKSEGFISFVTGDTGGDTSAGYSRTAVTCRNNDIGVWAQTQVRFNKYSGSTIQSGSTLDIKWPGGDTPNAPAITAFDADAGIKLDGGFTCGVNAAGTSFGPMKATAFTLSSGQDTKTDIEPLDSIVDALVAVRSAKGRRYRYRSDVARHGKKARHMFGVLAEEMPDELVMLTPSADGSGAEKSLNLGDWLGLVHAALGQLADQTDARLDAIETAMAGATKEGK
jgi:hypothetical protein